MICAPTFLNSNPKLPEVSCVSWSSLSYLAMDDLAIIEDLPEHALAQAVIGGEPLDGSPPELLLIIITLTLPPAAAEYISWVMPSLLEAGRRHIAQATARGPAPAAARRPCQVISC